MSNFVPSTPEAGIQPIGVISTTKNHPTGTIVKAFDATYGEGEFIYLPGCASTAVGSLVTWNQVTAAGTTTLVPSTAKLGYQVAVAMTANTATTSYAWYQISGVATVLKAATVVGTLAKLWVSATATVNAVSVAGKMVQNAIAVNSTVSATTYALAQINRPFMEGLGT